MAGWQGWETELLKALNEPVTPHNTAFLGEWEAAEHTDCSSNPLSATLAETGSKRCKELSKGEYAQAYTSHAQGLKATKAQLSETPYAAIRAALHSGDPYSVKNWQTVVGSLGIWGAHVFAAEYTQAMQAPVGGPPTTVPEAGKSLKAYNQFAHTLAHTLPAHLYRAQKLNRETLARLGK